MKQINISTISAKAVDIGDRRKLWEGYRRDTGDGEVSSVLLKNILHLHSEVSELYKAVTRNEGEEHIRDEGVDIVMVTLAILKKMGYELTPEDFEKSFEKNEKRIKD